MDNITLYVANKIKEFREKRNITQDELAEALNTTQQTIARYESGERKPNHNVLFDLAKYFKVSINDFFPYIEQDKNSKYVVLRNTLKNKKIINEDNEISNEDLDKLIDIAISISPLIVNKNAKKNTN